MPIALVTCAEARPLDEDLPPLVAAFGEINVPVEVVDWDDASIDWSRYAAVCLRSTWDYVPRLPEFLAWAGAVATQTRLFNPIELVRWSIDKHYLADLARAGVPVVPTRFVEPGADAAAAVAGFLAEFAPAELVIKPAVGAGSKDALRLALTDRDRAVAHVGDLLARGRSVMLQPYLASVDADGETAAVYIDGRYSHAIRKGPLLAPGGALVEGLFAAEDIRPRELARDEGRVAKLAYNAIPHPAPLYARVDLVRDASGAPVVLELELVEPSLFFVHGEGAAARYASAVAARVAMVR